MTLLFFFRTVQYLLVFTLFGLVFYAAGYGLDLSDETLYLMGFRYPGEIKIYCTWFMQTVFSLLGFSDPSIVEFRLFRLFSHIVGSLIFSSGILLWYRKQFSPADDDSFYLSFHGFILMGSLLSYALFPQTLSYNSLSLVLIQCCLGLAFFIRFKNLYLFHFIFYSALLGFAVFFLFLVKVPTGALLGIFCIFYLLAHRIIEKKWYLHFIGGIGLGKLLGILFFFSSLGEYVWWIGQFQACFSSSGAYQPGALFTVLWADIVSVFDFLRAIPAFLKMVFFLPMVLLFMKIKKTSVVWILGIHFAGLIYLLVSKGFYKGGTGHLSDLFKPYFWIFSGWMLASLMFGLKRKISIIKTWRKWSVLLWIALLSFAGVAGSANYPTVMLVPFLSLTFPLLFFANRYLLDVFPSWMKSILPVFISMLIFSQVYTGLFLYPYRISGEITENTIPLKNFKPASGLDIQQETVFAVDSIRLWLENSTDFKEGDLIFSGFSEMGLAYLSGGITPGIAPFVPSRPEFYCSVLSKVEKERRNEIIFLVDTVLDFNFKRRQCLKEAGFNFPDNYKCIGWVHHFGHRERKMKKLGLFVPKIKLNRYRNQ